VDSSTLEALFCKLKSLEDVPKGQLAGKMATVIDLMTRLPVDTAVSAVTKYSSSNEQTNFLNVEDSLSQGQRQLFYQSLPS
jgi:hypothetical protein